MPKTFLGSENDMCSSLGHICRRLCFGNQTSFWIILIWDTHVLRLELYFSQKKYAEVLSSSSSEYDFIWRWDLSRSNYVRMRSLGWAQIQYNWYPYERGKFGRRARHRGKTMWRHTETTPCEEKGNCSYVSPYQGTCGATGRWTRHGAILSGPVRVSYTLPTPWFQTSGFRTGGQ